ncbi:DNA excision repair protein CSB [Ceratocystis lukuohia]|uniref:DNA excision repair protein CSB n=1 Tax=Ceratocystis lukuohia TaxID=2019550 RepID=A0ABR4MJ54_9PEZI
MSASPIPVFPPSQMHVQATQTLSQPRLQTPQQGLLEMGEPPMLNLPGPDPNVVINPLPAPNHEPNIQLPNVVQSPPVHPPDHAPTFSKPRRRVHPISIITTATEAPQTSKLGICRPFLTDGTFSLQNRYPDSDDSSDSDGEGFSIVNTRRYARIQPKKAYKAVISVLNGRIQPGNLTSRDDSASDGESYIIGEHAGPDSSDLDQQGSENEDRAWDTTQNFLTTQAVNTIIDEKISEVVDIFTSDYLPRLRAKAFELWNEGRSERQIGSRLREASATVAHLENRISSIRTQMHLTKWSSRNSLWHQTTCLEPSVIDLEKNKWLIEVVKGPRPAKITASVKPRVKRRKIEYTPSDSECEVISDSELSIGFIVDDEIQEETTLQRASRGPIPPAVAPRPLYPESGVEKLTSAVAPTENTIPMETNVDALQATPIEKSPENDIEMLYPESSNPIPTTAASTNLESLPAKNGEKVDDMEDVVMEPDSAELGSSTIPDSSAAIESRSQEKSASPAAPTSTSTKNAEESLFCSENPPPSPSVISISDGGGDDDDDDDDEAEDFVTYDLSLWKAIPNRFKCLLPKELLEVHGDMGRALIGAIYSMSANLRQKLFTEVTACNNLPENFWNTVMIRSSTETSVQIAAIALFKCAISGTFDHIRPEVFQKKKGSITGALMQCHRNLPPFYRALYDIQAGFPQTADDLIAGSDESGVEDQTEADMPNQASKKKQRFISKEVTAAYEERMRREQARWDAKVELAKKSKLQAEAIPNEKSRLIINMSKSEDEPFIYIPDSVANATSEIFDSQIEGIRFIWDNVVANDGEVSSNGCMLAHTMGLGKTMQVISVLLAIVEATHSSNPTVVSQIPKQYRRHRFLILCPAPLVDNWIKEIERWAGNSMMPQVLALGNMHSAQRNAVVEQWSKNSGCLILSFALLGRLFKTGDEIMRIIANSADIAIADEAHALNNTGTNIRRACDEIKTMAKVALTGSPMANNTLEYYHMVNWVAPKYMGSEEDFKISYARPIEDANVADATPNERYRARQLLKRLTKKMRHKVHRATLASLPINVLPRKQEYIIGFPPLKGLQEKLYSEYVRLHKQYGFSSDFGALDNLSIILTHPKCFAMKLRGTRAGRRGGDADNDIAERETLPKEMSQALLEIVDQEPDLDNVNLSWRSRHIMSILDECRKVKEKVLVFSQYLDVLDYFQDIFERQGRKYSRIDGSTDKRVALVDRFNRQDYEVFLIATKAGGTGLNIQGASRIIIVDFKYNPMWEQQAIGRAFRIKQTKDVYVYRFVGSGSSESVMFHRAVFKMQLTDAVVDEKTQIARSELRKGSKVVHLTEPISQPYDKYLGVDGVLDKLLTDTSSQKGIVYVDHTDTFAEPDEEIPVSDDIAKHVNDELRAIEEREKSGGHAVPLAPLGHGSAAGGSQVYRRNAKGQADTARDGTNSSSNIGDHTMALYQDLPYHERPRLARLQSLVNEHNSLPAYNGQLPLTLDGSKDTDFPEHAIFRQNLRLGFMRAVGSTSNASKITTQAEEGKATARSMIIDDYLSVNIRGDLPRRTRENLVLDLMGQDRFALAFLNQLHGLTNNMIAVSMDRVLREKYRELEVMDEHKYRDLFPVELRAHYWGQAVLPQDSSVANVAILVTPATAVAATPTTPRTPTTPTTPTTRGNASVTPNGTPQAKPVARDNIHASLLHKVGTRQKRQPLPTHRDPDAN